MEDQNSNFDQMIQDSEAERKAFREREIERSQALGMLRHAEDQLTNIEAEFKLLETLGVNVRYAVAHARLELMRAMTLLDEVANTRSEKNLRVLDSAMQGEAKS